MNIVEEYLGQFDDEVKRTRRTLEKVPEGKDDWKPHDKSMPLGRLAGVVAQKPMRNAAELVKGLDEAAAQGRKALEGANEAHLLKPWRLLVSGNVVSEQPRHVVIRDTFSHLAHHRAQLGVYLRLNDVVVPAVY